MNCRAYMLPCIKVTCKLKKFRPVEKNETATLNAEAIKRVSIFDYFNELISKSSDLYMCINIFLYLIKNVV